MMPAATAAPDPDELPHGLRSSAKGLRVCPPTALQPDMLLLSRMLAHSLRLVLPMITMPAARNRAASGESRWLTLPHSARLPAVVGSGPATSILSLIRIGLPASDPRGLRASTPCACARQVGSIART